MPIINDVEVEECNYVILPKSQCPAKSMPYAKETSCIACKEHNTKLNFCKNNPDCYFKQLKRLKKGNDYLMEVVNESIIEQEKLVAKVNRNRLKVNKLHKALEKIKEIINYCENEEHKGCAECKYDECEDLGLFILSKIDKVLR